MLVVHSESSRFVPHVVLWGSTDPGSAHYASHFIFFGKVPQYLFLQYSVSRALELLLRLFALFAFLAFALFAFLWFAAFFRFVWFAWFAAFAWFSWFAAFWVKTNFTWWHFWDTILPNRLDPSSRRGFPSYWMDFLSHWRYIPSSWGSFPSSWRLFTFWLNTFLPWIPLFDGHFNTFFWRLFTFWSGFFAWKNATSVFKNISEVTAGTFSSHLAPIFALIADLYAMPFRSHPKSERTAFTTTVWPVFMAIGFHESTDSACISSDNHQNKTDQEFLIEYWLFSHGFDKFLWIAFALDRIYSRLET